MKIYLLKESDYITERDYIIAAYSSYEKALCEQKRHEKEQEKGHEKADKCSNCPLYCCDSIFDEDCWEYDSCSECKSKELIIERTTQYCNEYKPYEEPMGDYDKCVNYEECMRDDFYTYYIQECELIE